MAEQDHDRRTDTGIPLVDIGAVSRPAMRLFASSYLVSNLVGDPGVITDTFLSAISQDTTTIAIELEIAGLWRRTQGGYRAIA